MDETRATPAANRFAAALCALPLGLLRWSPVWVPLLLFAQISLVGLRASLAEDRRLEAEEQRLELRRAGLIRENADLEDLLWAQRDPIYLERERRLEAQRRWAEEQATREALAAALAPPAADSLPTRGAGPAPAGGSPRPQPLREEPGRRESPRSGPQGADSRPNVVR